MLHRILAPHPRIALRILKSRLRILESRLRRIAEARLCVRKQSWTLRMRTEDNLIRGLAFQQTEISHD